MKFTTTRIALIAGIAGLIGCTGSTSKTGTNTAGKYADQPYNFRLSLTDAPNDELKAVMVKVNHAELRIAGGGKEARLITAQNMGMVNLLDLQNGVTLPMADLQLPAGVEVTQIRLVLDYDDNYIIRSNGDRCDLKTPSEQRTGIKILIHQGVMIEPGFSYSMVVDFDAKKSVVLTGNGGCLLKPVLKLKSATRVEVEDPETPPGGGETPGEETPGEETPGEETPGEETPGEEVPGDETPGGETPDSSQEDPDNTGFDSGTDTTIPEVPAEDLSHFFEVSDM